jgi:hypothetical protein
MSESWDDRRSYYGQPVLKAPVWSWEIPCYFFTGGLAGASAGLAYVSGLRGEEVLAKRSWAAALGGLAVSPALLTSDLGKPSRFLNMFRMFKPTSPMSVGSWLLGASGAATAVATANAWTGLLPRTARLARPAAALLGLPLCTYTAALLSNTAVPAWHEARGTLPFVFGAGAALSAGAAATVITPPDRSGAARRLALGAAAVEIGVKEVMEQRLGQHGEAYKQGAPAHFGRVAQACIVTGATLLFRHGGSSRAAAMSSGTLLCAGALSARWSVFKAGFASASDPKYVVGPQRSRIERGERAGAARRRSRVESGDPSLGSPASTVGSRTPPA